MAVTVIEDDKPALNREIPGFIVEQYGSARAFRAQKRKELRALRKALEALRLACNWLPGGHSRVDLIAGQVKRLTEELSVKSWGR